jgi:uncharacterized protein YndB with AHSA1/START domain
MAQSSEFKIERSTTIAAPAADVHPWIADLHRWRAWSPWEGLDADLRRTYSGAASGPGQVYEWSGNRKAGAGRMEILESVAPAKVVVDLEFLKPFKGENLVTFDLTESGGVTTVRWEMRGPKTLIGRIFGLVFSMDKYLGGEFEKGLASLRTRAEGGPPTGEPAR